MIERARNIFDSYKKKHYIIRLLLVVLKIAHGLSPQHEVAVVELLVDVGVLRDHILHPPNRGSPYHHPVISHQLVPTWSLQTERRGEGERAKEREVSTVFPSGTVFRVPETVMVLSGARVNASYV